MLDTASGNVWIQGIGIKNLIIYRFLYEKSDYETAC